MDPPNTDVVEEVKQETFEEVKLQSLEEVLQGDPGYHCELCDTEVIHKIAEELLPGLASACVDNTTGGIFKSPGSVAVDIRKEMIEYITERSESYVAEFILSENPPVEEVSEHPYDIISDIIDDFARTKRNMFSRVSEWMLSDRREERIDDFVQEMEKNGFWLLARRETIATTLLKNVDYKNTFHCNIICSSPEDLVDHVEKCSFRPMDCDNEGCTARFCVGQMEHHDSICPFKILQCEQKCPEYLMRRDMDRHCITVCPMKLVNCAFYPVGCQSTIPRSTVEQHNSESLSSHLVCILQTIHMDATDEELKLRVEQLLPLTSSAKLARARDARSLTYLIKDPELKLGPLVRIPKVIEPEEREESRESPRSSKGGSPTTAKKESPTKETEFGAPFKERSESPTKKEVHPESESNHGTEDHASSPKEREMHLETSIEKEVSSTESPFKTEERKDSFGGEEVGVKSPQKESLTGEKESEEESSTKEDEHIGSIPPTDHEEQKELASEENEKQGMETPSKENEKEGMETPSKENEDTGSPTDKEVSAPSPRKGEDSTDPPKKGDTSDESSSSDEGKS